MAERWTEVEMYRLAASGVAKVDLLGVRGATLVSTEEVTAMAAVIALSGLLPSPAERLRLLAETEKFHTEETEQ